MAFFAAAFFRVAFLRETFFRVAFLREAFFRVAFLAAAFFRVAFLRAAFFRVAFFAAAFFRVAFLRETLAAVALRRAAVFFRVTLRRATFFLRTRVRAAVFFRVAFFRVLFAFFFMSDSAFRLVDRSKVAGAVRPHAPRITEKTLSSESAAGQHPRWNPSSGTRRSLPSRIFGILPPTSFTHRTRLRSFPLRPVIGCAFPEEPPPPFPLRRNVRR